MDNKIRLASSLQADSIVDGPGLRYVLWTQGCKHACQGCHNPETWKIQGGTLYDIDDIIKEMESNLSQTGITFSGGDPMFQPLQCSAIAKHAKKIGLDVWTYSGYTMEEILKLNDKDINEFLKYIDYLIDGKFLQDKKTMSLLYRGSTNQRIIDVQESLLKGTIVVVNKYDKREEITKENNIENVFL